MENETTLGVIAHVLGLLTGFIGPLVIFLVAKEKKGIAYENAKHALNFQLSVLIYGIVSVILVFVLIGFVLLLALGVFSVVVGILGAVRASEGKVYSYPLEIHFIK